MDADGLRELAESMSAVGQLQPVLVRRLGDRYVVIAGHRRVAAAQLLGWSGLRAIIVAADEYQASVMAWAENAQREGVSEVDAAHWIRDWIERECLTQNEAAAALGMSAPRLSELVAICGYDERLQVAIAHHSISASAARELAHIGCKEQRDYYVSVALETGVTSRQAADWRRTAERDAATRAAAGAEALMWSVGGAGVTKAHWICEVCGGPQLLLPSVWRVCGVCSDALDVVRRGCGPAGSVSAISGRVGVGVGVGVGSGDEEIKDEGS